MKCPKCGENIDKDSKTCKKCGEKIVKEKKEKKSKNKGKKKLDKKKKIIIISSVIIVLLIISIVTFIFVNQKQQTKKKDPEIKEDWGKKYYNYLKSIDKKDKYDDAGIPKNTKNMELGFYKVEDIEKPIMIINYEKDKEDYSNIYYIKNNKVNSVINEQPADVRLLYDIEKEDYVWFLHIPNGNEEKNKDLYKNLISLIENTEEVKEADYTIGSDDKTSQVTGDGTNIELSKYDETFINPKTTTWNFDFSLKKINKLKEAIIKCIKNINKEKKLVNDDIKKAVEKKLKEIKETQEKIETAKTELEKNASTSNTNINDASTNNQSTSSNTSGNLNLSGAEIKYGTHNVYNPDGKLVGSITIKNDGTYQVSGEVFSRVEKKLGKYHIDKENVSQDGTPIYVDALCLETNADGYSICLPPSINGTFVLGLNYFEYVG